MALKSNNPKHAYFLDTPVVLMDTCALTWFAKHWEFPAAFDRVANNFLILIPTPVLYELAFGKPLSIS